MNFDDRLVNIVKTREHDIPTSDSSLEVEHKGLESLSTAKMCFRYAAHMKISDDRCPGVSYLKWL